jgi:hypothetical protein
MEGLDRRAAVVACQRCSRGRIWWWSRFCSKAFFGFCFFHFVSFATTDGHFRRRRTCPIIPPCAQRGRDARAVGCPGGRRARMAHGFGRWASREQQQ